MRRFGAWFSRETVFRTLAVLLSSFLLACAFPLPPVLRAMEGSSAAWLALIPLILVARLSRPKNAFWWGWLCGFLFWLVSAAWVLELRQTWGFLPVVILAWVALAAYCALYTGLFAFLLAGIWPGGKRRLALVLIAPVIWVGCEYLRAVLLTGFPWNVLGASQYRNIAAIQLASWGGTYAVSGVIVLLNAALALTALRIVGEIRRRESRRRIHYELMLGLVAIALCWSWGVRTVRRGVPGGEAEAIVRIAAVQPNIPQVQKWSEAHRQDAYLALKEQTELAVMSRPSLMIWPETAIPDLLRIDPIAQSVVTSLVTNGPQLLVGSMDYEQLGEDVLYYNASFLVDSSSSIVGTYRKRHLVPFGEYVPFENQFALIKRLAPLGFSCVPGSPVGPLELRVVQEGVETTANFGVLICFEDVFPYLARKDVGAGARFLVNQTNDAWFDPSAASRQHMANAVFRAVENRVPLVRCANTGVTCFVDRFGRIVELLAGDDGGTALKGFSVSELRIPPADMPLTPYTRFGDWLWARPCAMLVIILLLIPFIQRWVNREKRP
jgi:apolipoprotein N-acyltransferase